MSSTAPDPRELTTALRKLTWRLIPFMFVLYVVAYLDRVNVGFAQLQMKQALGMSEGAYGLGAGLFFIGYFAFEVPSNLILARVGPRRWIARIMITWGVISSATMFAQGSHSFYGLRLLLGLAEAGFFPGMILYLTMWFPPRERAAAVARFMSAIGISLVLGAPLSGAILDRLHGAWGWQGWQWLFLLEGAPSVVLGFVVLAVLPDRPDDVSWLTAEEKRALAHHLAAAQPAERTSHSLRDALGDGRVWLLSCIYFILAMGLYGLTLWVPQIIKDVVGGSATRVGLVCAIPYVSAALGMVAWARYTDRTGRYRRNLTLSLIVAAAGTGAAALLLGYGPIPTLIALSVGIMGLFSSFGPFWAVPGAFLRGAAAAGGIAVINSFGNLGGFASPPIVGKIKQLTGSFSGGVAMIAAALLLAAVLVAFGVSDAQRAPGAEGS